MFFVRRSSAILVALPLIAAAAESAPGAGYWNIPGTCCQRLGCGYGAGYHAPLVLGPISCDGWCAPHVQQLPYPPTPVLSPAPACNCRPGIDSSHLFQPSVLLPSGTMTAPAPAAHRSPILR
jgi:hypothetical protein